MSIWLFMLTPTLGGPVLAFALDEFIWWLERLADRHRPKRYW